MYLPINAVDWKYWKIPRLPPKFITMKCSLLKNAQNLSLSAVEVKLTRQNVKSSSWQREYISMILALPACWRWVLCSTWQTNTWVSRSEYVLQKKQQYHFFKCTLWDMQNLIISRIFSLSAQTANRMESEH